MGLLADLGTHLDVEIEFLQLSQGKKEKRKKRKKGINCLEIDNVHYLKGSLK